MTKKIVLDQTGIVINPNRDGYDVSVDSERYFVPRPAYNALRVGGEVSWDARESQKCVVQVDSARKHAEVGFGGRILRITRSGHGVVIMSDDEQIATVSRKEYTLGLDLDRTTRFGFAVCLLCRVHLIVGPIGSQFLFNVGLGRAMPRPFPFYF